MLVSVLKGKIYKVFDHGCYVETFPLDRLRKELLISRWMLLKNIDLVFLII